MSAFAPQGNELFIHMSDRLAAKLRNAGIIFHPWPSLGPDAYRFVCASNSPVEMITALPDTIAQ